MAAAVVGVLGLHLGPAIEAHRRQVAGAPGVPLPLFPSRFHREGSYRADARAPGSPAFSRSVTDLTRGLEDELPGAVRVRRAAEVEVAAAEDRATRPDVQSGERI